ncbi:MAG: ComF family protein [Gemmataceae bacterium]|nr:ComF family protein [Gemmata sp.]MDW8199313.1 ComF family protein [Gemmataceae bacterium]
MLGPWATEMVRQLLAWIYPNACLVCDALEQPPEWLRHGLCGPCYRAITGDGHESCPRCGQTIGPHTLVDGGCPHCRAVSFPFERVFRLGPYTGRLREAILRIKAASGEGLAEMLGRVWAESRGGLLPCSEIDGVVPVPLHWRRKWTRGYNQAEAVARELARYLSLPFWPRVLRRVRSTPQQLQPSRAARRDNVRGAFCVRRGAKLAGRTLLLVDDVMTTGSTLSEAAQTLRHAGAARVFVAVLARD